MPLSAPDGPIIYLFDGDTNKDPEDLQQKLRHWGYRITSDLQSLCNLKGKERGAILLDLRYNDKDAIDSFTTHFPSTLIHDQSIPVIAIVDHPDTTRSLRESGITHIGFMERSPSLKDLARLKALLFFCLSQSPILPTTAPNGTGNGFGGDALTGLSDITQLSIQLEKLLNAKNKSPSQINCGLLLIAVSRFEQINVTWGRNMADRLLRAVAKRLQKQLSTLPSKIRAWLYRPGGAEFALLIDAPEGIAQLTEIAEQVIDCFDQPFILQDKHIYLSSRIGIALANELSQNWTIILHNAYTALSYAKKSDPNSYRIFVPEDADSTSFTARLESDLRQAISNGQIVLYYQPQVDGMTGKIYGLEALVRWIHPDLGTIAPEVILNIAENTELSMILGDALLSMALQDMTRQGQALDEISLSVNMTAAQLRRPDFTQTIQALFDRTGFPPQRLTLELTETEIMTDLNASINNLHSLRNMKMKIAIDDFGTGYSSLSYIQNLPVDCIKIDRSFVTEMNQENSGLIPNLISIAQDLHIRILAEGVETEEQKIQLAREGCTFWQGFLCSPPMPLANLAGFIKDWNARPRPLPLSI